MSDRTRAGRIACPQHVAVKPIVIRSDSYADASYMEGVACFNGSPLLEHGWVCRPEGTIIDPTLPRDEGVYFPGLEFRGRTGICEFLATSRGRKCKISPFLYAFGWGGRYSPGIMRHWEQGNAHLRELVPEAFKKSPTKDQNTRVIGHAM